MPPYRKKSTYRRKKKAYFRKKKRYARKLSPPVGSGQLIGYPKQRLVKMRFCDLQSLGIAAGSVASYTYRANSIWDPNLTGVGSTPTGYTTWSGMYDQYVVVGSKISVRYAFYASDGIPVQVTILTEDESTTTLTNFNTLEQTGRAPVKTIQPYVQGGNNIAFQQSKWSAKKYFNIKDVKDNQSAIGAAFGANPSRQAYWIIAFKGCGTTSCSVYISVKIDYLVLVGEPINLYT